MNLFQGFCLIAYNAKSMASCKREVTAVLTHQAISMQLWYETILIILSGA